MERVNIIQITPTDSLENEQFISQIATLEAEIFSDAWSVGSIKETLKNPQARIWVATAIPSGEPVTSKKVLTAIPSGKPATPKKVLTAAPSGDFPQVLGYVIFYYVLDEGEIARIAVSPFHRRQGLAASLLGKMSEFSRQNGITRWLLDVRMSNEPAIHFYESAGFVRDGVRKNFYANPVEDAILMSCITK